MDVCLNEEYPDDQRVFKQKVKNGQDSKIQENQPDEVVNKKKKKTVSTPLVCDVSNYYLCTEKEINEYFEIESIMINQDKHTHELYGSKNELESYIYLMKDRLSSNLKDYTTPLDNERIRNNLDE